MMDFDKTVEELVYSIDPTIKIREAVGNEDAEESFRDEENYQVFVDKGIKGVEFDVAESKRDDLVTLLQNKLGDNYFVYCSAQNFGHEPDEITILATKDNYDAIYFEGTNGINYDITVEDIVAHLKELATQHPFVLTGAGFDFLQGDFTTPLTDIDDLSESMYEFCPDIVEQGVGSVKELANELKKSNAFYYWWD